MKINNLRVSEEKPDHSQSEFLEGKIAESLEPTMMMMQDQLLSGDLLASLINQPGHIG